MVKEQNVKAGVSCRGVRAIAPSDHILARKILHRKAIGVKLHRTLIVSSEMTNRYKILNNVGSNKDVIKIKGTGKCRITYGGNQKR
jgi:hypothetical protein